MGILVNIKHLAPLSLYVVCLLFFLKSLMGDGRWALLLATFLIPLRNVIDKIENFPLGNQTIDILIAGALVAWVVPSLVNKKKLFEHSTLNTIVIILVLYMFFSLFIGSHYLNDSFSTDFFEKRVKDWKNFCLMPLLFFINLNYITEKKWIYRVLVVMGLAMIIMEYYTIKQISIYSSLVSRDKISGTLQFLGPNEVGAFFNEYTVILIGLLFFIKKNRIKLVLLALVCINIYCILFVYSRGAYLGLFAGAGVLCLFKHRKFLFPLILLGIFWQSFLPLQVVERIKQTSNEYGQLDTSAQRRINIWEYSLELFQKNPLTGIGLGVFQYLGLDLGDTHNIYVKYLVEQGLVGFIIFLIVIFCFLRMGYVLYKKGEDDLSRGMGLGLMGCMVVLMVNNLFGDRWSYMEISSYLWIFAGLVGRLIILAEKPESMPEVQQNIKSTSVPLEKPKKKIRFYDL